MSRKVEVPTRARSWEDAKILANQSPRDGRRDLRLPQAVLDATVAEAAAEGMSWADYVNIILLLRPKR
jgi:predicted DNA binding CopG/RHH family protein